jgi:hypothetical protein
VRWLDLGPREDLAKSKHCEIHPSSPAHRRPDGDLLALAHISATDAEKRQPRLGAKTVLDDVRLGLLRIVVTRAVELARSSTRGTTITAYTSGDDPNEA